MYLCTYLDVWPKRHLRKMFLCSFIIFLGVIEYFLLISLAHAVFLVFVYIIHVKIVVWLLRDMRGWEIPINVR